MSEPPRDILAVRNLDDADTTVVRTGAELARHGHGRLSLLSVADPGPATRHLARLENLSTDAIVRQLMQQQRAKLDAALAVAGGDAEHSVRVGKGFVETVRRVLDRGHDLVLKAADELDGRQRHLLASTDQHLLRKCPCPVWLHRRSAPARPRVVLAAVDVDRLGAAEPDTQAALNDRILALAGQLAGWAGAALHVVHAWDAPVDGLVRSFAGRRGAGDYVAEVEAQTWGWLTAAIDRMPDAGHPAPQAHLRRGAARQVVPDLVGELDADLLVMGTVARTGVPGLIIGNTAEDVLNSVAVSIAAVKPPGWVSPLAR